MIETAKAVKATEAANLKYKARYVPTLKTTVALGLLTAFSVVLGAYLSFPLTLGGVYIKNFSFNTLPVQLAGFLYGPAAGFATGAASDILKWILNSKGAYLPVYTFSMGMMGFAPAFIVQIFLIIGNKKRENGSGDGNELRRRYGLEHERGRGRGREKKLRLRYTDGAALNALTFPRILISAMISQIIFSLGFNTFFIARMGGMPFLAALPMRVVSSAILIPLCSLINYECVKLLKRYPGLMY